MPGLVHVYKKLLKMPIDIVDLPIEHGDMVDFSSSLFVNVDQAGYHQFPTLGRSIESLPLVQPF